MDQEMEKSPNCDFSRFVIAFQVLHSVPPQELTFSGAVVVLIQHAHSYGRLKRATFRKKTMQPLWKIDPSRVTCTYHTQSQGTLNLWFKVQLSLNMFFSSSARNKRQLQRSHLKSLQPKAFIWLMNIATRSLKHY
jgi:hypothetical protein